MVTSADIFWGMAVIPDFFFFWGGGGWGGGRGQVWFIYRIFFGGNQTTHPPSTPTPLGNKHSSNLSD